MIICTKCGFQNEDSDTFCGSCAAFLEWAGEKQAVEPEPEPEVVPEPEPVVEHGLLERVKERIVGVGEARTTGSGGGADQAPEPAAQAAPAVEPTPVAVAAEAPAPVAVSAPSVAVSASTAVGAPSTVASATTTAGPPRTDTAASTGAAPAPKLDEPRVTDVTSRAPASPTVDRAAGPPASAPPLGGTSAPSAPSAPSPAPTATPSSGPFSSSAPAATPSGPAPSTARPAAGTTAGAQTSSPASPTAAPSPSASAASPVAPVQPAPVAPGPVAPSAVKPGAVKSRPAAKPKAPEQRVINPGDLICGQCGDGNDPIRKFCRRCGASLQQAVAFVPPWYKRLILRLRKRKVRAAGERPRMRRRAFGGAGGGWISSIFTKILLLAIIVFVVLTFVGPFSKPIKHRFSSWYHSVKNAIHTTYDPVHPVGATATSAAAGHPATNAIDNASNTSWEAGGTRSGLGETLTITLQSPSNLDKIGFLNGDNDTSGAYLTEPRLETVLITFKSAAGTSTKSITLGDTPNFQSYSVSAKQVTSLTLTIESVYASAQGQNAALTEVELFHKA